ncbi:unnamed protein product, partial [Cylicostephanus goldi]
EAGLKVAAVEVPSTDQNERRTRDGDFFYPFHLCRDFFFRMLETELTLLLGKWTLRQLRQTDAIVPLQSGTNQFDSQRVSSFFSLCS